MQGPRTTTTPITEGRTPATDRDERERCDHAIDGTGRSIRRAWQSLCATYADDVEQMPPAELTYTPAADYPARTKPRSARDPDLPRRLEAETRAKWLPLLQAARSQEAQASAMVRAELAPLSRPCQGRPLRRPSRSSRPPRPRSRRRRLARRGRRLPRRSSDDLDGSRAEGRLQAGARLGRCPVSRKNAPEYEVLLPGGRA
jgi:hypothetical protein